MNVSFSLKLTCDECEATVELSGSETRSDPYVLKKLGRKQESPKPKIPWRRDGTIIKKLNEARKYVLQNPKIDGTTRYITGPIFDVPPYVGVHVGFFDYRERWAKGETYVQPVEFRFIDCPACGGRAYLGSREKNADTSI